MDSYNRFIEKNLWSIGESTKEIFEKVSILDEVVVLFDELDELVRQRGTEQEILSRFMTTTILPHFQNLASSKKIIFIIATNRIRDFDPAIQRPGRFDIILNVNQPARSELIKHFNTLLLKNNIDEHKINTFSNYLKWECFKDHLYDIIGNSEIFNNELKFNESINTNNLLDEFLLKSRDYINPSQKEQLKKDIKKCETLDGLIVINSEEDLRKYKNRTEF